MRRVGTSCAYQKAAKTICPQSPYSFSVGGEHIVVGRKYERSAATGDAYARLRRFDLAAAEASPDST